MRVGETRLQPGDSGRTQLGLNQVEALFPISAPAAHIRGGTVPSACPPGAGRSEGPAAPDQASSRLGFMRPRPREATLRSVWVWPAGPARLSVTGRAGSGRRERSWRSAGAAGERALGPGSLRSCRFAQRCPAGLLVPCRDQQLWGQEPARAFSGTCPGSQQKYKHTKPTTQL